MRQDENEEGTEKKLDNLSQKTQSSENLCGCC